MCYFEEVFAKLKRSTSVYWFAYGGWKEFFRSPYVYVAFLLAILVMLMGEDTHEWRTVSLSAIPSMLGFTLGGYALLVGFSDKDFMKMLIRKYSNEEEYGTVAERPTPYMQLSGAFAHFIVTQTLTLAFAYICKVLNTKPSIFDAIGNFMLLYTMALVIAATFAVVTFADSYDSFGNIPPPTKTPPPEN